MSLQGLNDGFVTFDNGEMIDSAVWFRMLRVFVREICKIENISYIFREKIREMWKKVGLDHIPRLLFELLKQEERIAIISIISNLIANWPNNIISLLGKNFYCYGYKEVNKFPYVLAKYIDFPFHEDFEEWYNEKFYLKCLDLRIEGWWNEFRYNLNLNKENILNFSKYLKNILIIDEKISLIIIKNILDKEPCNSLVFTIANSFAKNNFEFSSKIKSEEIYNGKERIPRNINMSDLVKK